MTSSLDATLARIDAVTTEACAACDKTLTPNGPSDVWCSEHCQTTWHKQHGNLLADQVSLELFFADFADALARTAESVNVFLSSVADALVPAAAAFRDMHKQLVDAGLIEDQEPTGPKARALHRVRNRNTGPRGKARPPRSLGVARTSRRA